MRDDAESDPAMHPIHAAVATAGETVAMLEHADLALAARPPSQRATEPAGARLTAALRQGHTPHTAGLCRHGVGARAETAVGDRKLGGAATELRVPVQRRHPQLTVRPARRTDGVVGDSLMLGFLKLHDLAELGRLRGLALANHLRLRLKDAE